MLFNDNLRFLKKYCNLSKFFVSNFNLRVIYNIKVCKMSFIMSFVIVILGGRWDRDGFIWLWRLRYCLLFVYLGNYLV